MHRIIRQGPAEGKCAGIVFTKSKEIRDEKLLSNLPPTTSPLKCCVQFAYLNAFKKARD